MTKRDFDAVVVGSGPNGLAAAITLQQAGLSVLLLEGKNSVGGGLRTAELTLPGFRHDVCSAIHPLAAESPFFKTLPLQAHGLEYIYPPVATAHPLANGTAAVLEQSMAATVARLGMDASAYQRLISPVANDWPALGPAILGPLRWPKHPLAMAQFGLKGLLPASTFANLHLKTTEARALWGGMAAHAQLPLTHVATSAIGLVLLAMGHRHGWPLPKGGSQAIATALTAYFVSLGGQVQTNFYVKSLAQLPSAHAVLLDVTPRQLLGIAGHAFSALYKWQLERYRYGMGVFKIDWALAEPIPFTAPDCRRAGTVHLGNTLEEITAAEQLTWNGTHPEKPFVLLAQQSLFDTTRAPTGQHTAWAYCHVPHGSTRDMTAAIEQQVERFAPGFRERILARHVLNTAQMEDYNPNYIGGDINGGVLDIGQLFTRPVLRFSPYQTSAKGLYICSSSTPPGGGVHGMCGYHAARRALQDVFGVRLPGLA
ncbi:NAD(P)/FAD-dependent oxidoreductase [Hymenobacter sp. BT683]|uniref:NAD(P)/FAD-dependent oxidoreductase n=1 Tax=Hymenobacter jeongseonensis TaxID=2791027 RepID=A0ABS0IDR8_9BACT|nr:NAD(P)/FAD-dependent oxidoreductase [Hymenobacter jeongseonensis]MBF9236505.1 NAD(P)/FAD-dependent oxidoreductase [Hymenobacter jeongseonensis]